jgi:hypothetical protein
MKCVRGFAFSPGAPLRGGAGLGSLSSTAMRYLGSAGCGMLKFLEKLLFQRNLCLHDSHETIWLQKEAPFMVKLGERGLQNYFCNAAAKAAV